MIEVIASTSYFEFFPGDFIIIPFFGYLAWRARKKEDDEFYG